jgi:hypothetical protein
VIAGPSKSAFKAAVGASPEAAPSAGFAAGFGGDLHPHSFEGRRRVVDVSAIYWAGEACMCMIGLQFGRGGAGVCEGKLHLIGTGQGPRVS